MTATPMNLQEPIDFPEPFVPSTPHWLGPLLDEAVGARVLECEDAETLREFLDRPRSGRDEVLLMPRALQATAMRVLCWKLATDPGSVTFKAVH